MTLLALRGLALLVCLSAGCGGNSTSTPSTDGSGGSGGAGPQNPNPTAFATSYCMKAMACGAAPATCTDTISAILWPADCQSALLQASCSDIEMTSLPPALATLCTPPCSPSSTFVCNADGTLTECTASGVQETADCHAVCATQAKTFSGVCAETYMGMESSKGHAVCWCL